MVDMAFGYRHESDSGGCAQMKEGSFERETVAMAAETNNDAGGNVGKIGMPAEWLAGMDIGQMDFDEGDGNGRQRIAQSHAGMCVAGGIDDDEADLLLAGRLNTVDQLTFVVALEAFQAHATDAGPRFHRGMNVSERGMPVNPRLARAKQVEVGSVKYQNSRALIGAAGGFVVCLLRHDRKFAANDRSLSSLLLR